MLIEGLIPYFLSDNSFAVVFGMIALLIVSYLLGSINSAIMVSKILYRDDIRKYGSGNAGLTNMHRTFGMKAAGLTLLGDMLKTVLSVLLALFTFGFRYSFALCINPLAFLAGAAAVVGHVYPVFYGFKGGKGVLVMSTMALVVSPAIFFTLLLVFIGVVALSKYISLGSVSVAILYPVFLNAYHSFFLKYPPAWTTVLVTILLALFVFWLHRENLKRINDRTERKFSFKKKPTVEVTPDEGEDGEDE